MKLVLPVPPSSNRYWRLDKRNGHLYPSEEAKRYKHGLKLRALTEGLRKPLAGPVVASVVVYRARRAGDLDNSLKVLLDALNGVAFEDDSQVIEIHARREDDPSNPRVEVRVEAMVENPAKSPETARQRKNTTRPTQDHPKGEVSE